MLASPALPLELRGNDLGVVEDQHVARPEQLRQIEHLMVGNLAAAHDEQPRAVPRPRRPQRDAIGRKVEIEIGDAHCAGA